MVLIAAACAAAMLCGPTALAQSAADFYAGRTVRIVFGTATGGDYGLHAQLIAHHIGKFVPGKPTVIVQSMPGGGGLNALGYVATAAPQDGTVLSLPHINIVQDGLLNPNVQFDPGKFQWIGRVSTQLQVGVASGRSNVRSLADARAREVTAGGTAVNSPNALNPRILNALAGTRFKIVTGYKGTGEVMIAWDRGEVDVVTTSLHLIESRYGDALKAGMITPLYVYATTRPPALSHVPAMTEFGRTQAEKAFLKIYAIGPAIGRSLAAPPGVPKERVELWRVAFSKMLEDPEFRAAVGKGNIRLDPLDGEILASTVADVINLPAENIAGARKFYDALLAATR